jgi:hypothetical protein
LAIELQRISQKSRQITMMDDPGLQ